MPEWLYEDGIGEARAALVQGGNIIEAEVELPATFRAGAVVPGRLRHILIPKRRGLGEIAGGEEILVEPLPVGLTEGAAAQFLIVREALAEPGRTKRAKGRVAEDDERAGPTLLQRLETSGYPVAPTSPTRDLLEEAGWSELVEEAASGEIAFTGGALRMSLTPAMTLFDVDGVLPPVELATAGAAAAGRAIRRLGIGGSIGIDLPTLSAKEGRQRAAAALDVALPQPFERTAVNGFGFLQIVRRKERASLPELLQGDPAGAAARALLRRAERSSGAGQRTLVAAPAVIARLEANPDWLGLLARRTGCAIGLQADPALSISGGHVHSQFA